MSNATLVLKILKESIEIQHVKIQPPVIILPLPIITEFLSKLKIL